MHSSNCVILFSEVLFSKVTGCKVTSKFNLLNLNENFFSKYFFEYILIFESA